MSKIYSTVSVCLKKPQMSDKELTTSMPPPDADDLHDPEELKENDAPELKSDKKTDEIIEPQKPSSLMWRFSSGLYSTTTGAIGGAVGLGVGSVKWVAGKGYDAGTAVVTTTKTVASKVPLSVPKWKKKAKNE